MSFFVFRVGKRSRARWRPTFQEVIMFTFNIEYRSATGGLVHEAKNVRASAPEAIKKGLKDASDVQKRQIKLTVMRKVKRFLTA